ncbi:class A beta-lactamase-related serine hydrolase [Mucilaginibacter conchicola]|uniref:Class A beta-lactamase-related serine hydrolase n=1 Tax=Mucilaginibacter conchicola TaxID=2303333 RepID=A0A372NQ95_9SPHI|nr:serine hydrolase domain-containing protein [Mucilaginibacter conchicola]RFZ90545.1 class A beta-lactamase-related serine hydrolase [Mucilaginibacter conchicola]
MIKKILALALTAAGLAASVQAQTINKPRLDSLLNVLAANNKSMGSLAISQNGQIVYQKSIGNAAIDSPATIPATAKTKYRIGSISKMFTGVMVMQLVEEGKLTLETTLDKFYPQVPNAAKITIGMMLNHHSGLHNFTNDPAYNTYMLAPQTHEQLLARIAAMKPDFEPGSKAQYSNTNFVLLSYVIEKITQKSYAELVKQRVVNKIGLKDTYYGVKTNTANNEALSYTYDGKWNKFAETDMSIPSGAGAMVSTPADLDKFIESLFAGKLVKPATLELMKTMKDGYGMAMFLTINGDKQSYGHGGAIDAYRSELAYFPVEKIAICYISNGGSYGIDKIFKGVKSIVLNQTYTIPTFKTLALKTEDLDKYLGVYTSPDFPVKITMSKDNTTLVGTAAGQSAIKFDAVAKNVFEFEPYDIHLEFDVDKGQFILTQRGKITVFTKE